MIEPVRLLGQMKGVWLASRTTPPGPNDPPLGAGCPIGDTGRRLVIELFYNPNNVMRFGIDTFGSEAFGEYTGAAPTQPEWVDVTQVAYGAIASRGNIRPNVEAPTDSATFNLYDPNIDYIDWAGETALASPNINTPVRLGIQARTGQYFQFYQGRVTRIIDLHDNPVRDVQFETFGNKADLITRLLDPNYPKQTAQARIDWILNEIGWGNGYDPTYPNPELATGLEADQEVRVEEFATAYYGIQQAALSSGLRVSINRLGQFRLLPILPSTPPVPSGVVFSDCRTPGDDTTAVYNAALFVSDTAEVANVIQLVNRPFPQKSAEASDPSSIAKWGRRADGYGLPLYIANDDTGETQTLADNILSAVKDIVNRVETVTFNTLTDPSWWDAFGQIEIGTNVLIRRTLPAPVEFNCNIIGVDWVLSENGYIAGTINLMTTDPTI